MIRYSPIISVGMPVYNGERYLDEAIKSILRQSFSDFEFIISDNSSTDSTQEICQKYAREDSRIKYIRQQRNLGAPRNCNYVFESSRGTYFKWASDNDICHREMLTECKKILDKQPDVVLCYPRTKLIDQNGRVFDEYEDSLHLQDNKPSDRFIKLLSTLKLNNAQNGLIRSEILRKTALEGTYRGGDIPLMAELTLYGTFHQIPRFLFYRRVTSDASTISKSSQELDFFNRPKSFIEIYLPDCKSYLSLFAAVNRSKIELREKLLLYIYLIKCSYWDKNELLKELISATRKA